MSGASVADLLADLIGPPEWSLPGGTPAKAANSAKTRASISSAADSEVCEGLRISANPAAAPAAPPANSQLFAGIRRGCKPAQSKHPCGFSQDSQDSQGVPGAIASERARSRPYKLTLAQADAAHAEPWVDAAVGLFVASVGLFLRRGIDADDADDIAERLHLRDAQMDDRRLCLECTHLAGRAGAWRCGDHRAARVLRDVPGDLVARLQRCPGFRASHKEST